MINAKTTQQWPLKTRVTLFTLAVLLVCMWSLNLLAGHALRQGMQRIMGRQQLSTVSFIAANIDQALLQRQQALLSVAARIGPALMDDPTAMQRYLDSLRVFQSMFNAGTMVTGRDAIAMASVPAAARRIGVNYADRDFMVAALAQGRATVGQPVLGRPLKVPLFAMAVPILDADGKPHGAVGELAQLAGADAPLRRLQTAKQREVGLLVNGFNRLLDTLAQREAALRVAKVEAEAANRAKSRFLAAASHDLRQPLAALTLYVDILAQAPAPGQEKLSARLQDCTANLGTLLGDLLDVSKLDSGVVAPTVCDFSLDSLRAPLLAVHGLTAQSKGLRLVWRSSAMLVRTDPHLLQRIVGNLIANAVRFTQQGGVLVAGRRHAGRQWLEVWDTGVGVAADQTEAIFEEFRQLGDSARNRGSGLGLAIVAKSAALLGLQIRLRSRPGRGSVFAHELPMGAAAPSLPVAPRLGRPVALRIGLVEDNAQVLAAMAAVLEGMGHTVLAGTDCAQMLEQLGERAPDIVISDYRLACGATGYDVIEAARAVFGAALPALIITGDTNPELIREMATKGIAVHFKPLQVDALQEFIRQAVEQGAP